MNDAIEPRITVKDYDEQGCWHPRWMDESGEWHNGWGWYDEDGEWQVQQGHYGPNGEWFPAGMTTVTEPVPEAVFDPVLQAKIKPGFGTEEPIDEDAEQSLPVIGRFDNAPIPYVGISAGAHVLFLILAMTVPDSARAIKLDRHLDQNRFVQVALTDMQKKQKKIPGFAGEDAAKKKTAKHAENKGKAGDPDEAETEKRLAVKGPASNEDLEIAKARNQKIAQSARIASQVTSMWATADQSIGSDAMHALGNVNRAAPGASRGVFDLGIQWDGRGAPPAMSKPLTPNAGPPPPPSSN